MKASSFRPSRRSMNYDSMKSDEKIISNFLLKYLERKDMYESKYLLHNASMNMKDSVKIDPKFRRTYLKKIKQEKKLPDSKFIIGVLD